MWPFTILRSSKSKSNTYENGTDDKPKYSIEDYVRKSKWISLKKVLEKDEKHFGYSIHFERWINYWVAADHYLRDSHVERYVECALTVTMSPRFVFADGSPAWIVMNIEMSWLVNDTVNEYKRWDTLFHKEVVDTMPYWIHYNRKFGIRGGDHEDILRIISLWFEILKGEKINKERANLISNEWIAPNYIYVFPVVIYKEKIQDIEKILKTVNGFYKRFFTLFSEDVTIEEDNDCEMIITLTSLKEKPLFDLEELDEINHVKDGEVCERECRK